ncbi:hypothetical protein ACO0QE_000177 [Hanseniaspora vineae]
MNQLRSAKSLSEQELELGILDVQDTWHEEYKDNAYVYFGQFNKNLTEADILTIFSQFGNPVDLRLFHDSQTGCSSGFGYLKYEDQRSTILAVDNLDGVHLLGNFIKVDHAFYRPTNKMQLEKYRSCIEAELTKDFVSTKNAKREQTPILERTQAPKRLEQSVEEADVNDPMASLLGSDLLLPYEESTEKDE